MVVFSRLPPKGDLESMKITRNENIQKSRKHTGSQAACKNLIQTPGMYVL